MCQQLLKLHIFYSNERPNSKWRQQNRNTECVLALFLLSLLYACIKRHLSDPTERCRHRHHHRRLNFVLNVFVSQSIRSHHSDIVSDDTQTQNIRIAKIISVSVTHKYLWPLFFCFIHFNVVCAAFVLHSSIECGDMDCIVVVISLKIE